MSTHTTSKLFVKELCDYDVSKILNVFTEILNQEPFFSSLKDKNKILIKPNLLGAHHPEKAVTTHPAMLEAMILFLKSLNKEILVGDSPGGVASAPKVWKETGILEVCERHNIKLIDFGKDGIVSKSINNVDFHFEKQLFEVDGIINMAKMKTHSLMLYTGAVKNLYGLIPGLYKSELHKKFPQPKDFANVLGSIYLNFSEKLVFSVLDGIVGMEGEGPASGKPRHFNRIYISEHASAIDFYASKYMGFKIEQLDYLQTALKIDNITPEQIEIEDQFRNQILPDVAIKEVQFRKKFLDSLPPFVKGIFTRLFSYYPYFNKTCVRCAICVKSCPVSALKLEKGDKVPVLDKQKCIKCMCCHELCPYHVVTIKKTFLAKMFLKSM